MTADLNRYQVRIADWAIPPDAIALEHLHDGDNLSCLVACTTLPFTFANMIAAIEHHDADCRWSKQHAQDSNPVRP